MDSVDWSAWDGAETARREAANDDEPGFGRALVMRILRTA